MTDPNTPTTPSSNPQDLIDQALGGTPPTPTVTPEPTPAATEPTLPTPEPLTPPAATEDAPVSTEPVLPPTETVPTELTSAPVTPMMEEPPVDTKPMGEDMPLAFAAAAPVDTTPTKAPESYIEPVNPAAVVPPILTTPTSDSAAPKKKSKKMVGLIVGILAFLGILGIGGLVSYQMYGAEAGLIAFVSKFTRIDGELVRNPDYEKLTGTEKEENDQERNEYLGGETVEVQKGNKGTDQASCNGCLNGGWMVWRDGECKITGVCGSNVPGKDTENPMEVTEKPATGCSSSNASTCCGAGYQYCGGAINKCVSNSALTGKGCNGYGLEVYGIAINYGATAFKGTCDSAKVSSGLQTSCNCGSGNVCFERRGDCFLGSGDGNSASDYAANVDSNPNNDNPNIIARSDGSYVNMGLCGLVSSYKPTKDGGNISENTKFFEKAECFECGEDGCKIKTGLTGASADKCYGANGCTTVRYTCDETKSGVSCLENRELLGNNATFKAGCGTVEQVDVMCGGQYIASRTRINPECTEDDTPNPSTPTITTNPTLMCSNLTRTPTTTPVIGDKVTFTCVGASVPAGSVNLSYKFRYSLNSGAYLNLANKTATTSELTIAACGNYSVECQACGTINGVLTCDPTWAGATTQ